MRAEGPGNDTADRGLEQLGTEGVDDALRDLDLLSTLQMVAAMHERDRAVVAAVGAVTDDIARAVDAIAERMRLGGRLVYLGAGTSGRLGVLDASECPPTFGTDPALVVGVIAGGETALRSAVEGAEDDEEQGARDLVALEIGELDTVVGLAASGRTPYVLGGLAEASARGALTVAVAANSGSRIGAVADLAIEPSVGPELIAGSTRLGAGTAQKLVLNTLSTLVMVRLGKTYGNEMVDLKATNAKLAARARRTVVRITGADDRAAEDALRAADGSVKTAVYAVLSGRSAQEAARDLAAVDGRLREALEAAGISPAR